jgi:hypothetical protein
MMRCQVQWLFFAFLCVALPSAGQSRAKTVAELRGGVLAVLEFNSKLGGDEKRAVDRGYLSERVRKFAKELLISPTARGSVKSIQRVDSARIWSSAAISCASGPV